jgi:hypothetical protein
MDVKNSDIIADFLKEMNDLYEIFMEKKMAEIPRPASEIIALCKRQMNINVEEVK